MNRKFFNGKNCIKKNSLTFTWFVHEKKFFKANFLDKIHGLYMKGTNFRTGKRIPFYTLYRGVVPLENSKKNFEKNLKVVDR